MFGGCEMINTINAEQAVVGEVFTYFCSVLAVNGDYLHSTTFKSGNESLAYKALATCYNYLHSLLL